MDIHTKNLANMSPSEQTRLVKELKISLMQVSLKIQETKEKLAQATCLLSGEPQAKPTGKDNEMTSKIMINGVIIRTGDLVCDDQGNNYIFTNMCRVGIAHVKTEPEDFRPFVHVDIQKLRLPSQPIEDGQTIEI